MIEARGRDIGQPHRNNENRKQGYFVFFDAQQENIWETPYAGEGQNIDAILKTRGATQNVTLNTATRPQPLPRQQPNAQQRLTGQNHSGNQRANREASRPATATAAATGLGT